MPQTLYLASQSQGRRKLLELAQIPYHTIEHTSDECGIALEGSFQDYVLAIAKHKMKHIVTPDPESTTEFFVLTADTLMRTEKTKQILGKPKDKDDAKRMLALLRQEHIELATGCCLEKKEYNNTWHTTKQEHWVNTAKLEFYVDEELVDLYLEKVPQAMYACGAGVVEGFGMNFFKQMNGSFSAIVGLPLFELQQKLKQIGFN